MKICKKQEIRRKTATIIFDCIESTVSCKSVSFNIVFEERTGKVGCQFRNFACFFLNFISFIFHMVLHDHNLQHTLATASDYCHCCLRSVFVRSLIFICNLKTRKTKIAMPNKSKKIAEKKGKQQNKYLRALSFLFCLVHL